MEIMLEIDGSRGEGGGQILRTSLSLSALTGRPFRLINIRANRTKPGLRPQHLTAVRAAAIICQATLRGDAINSQFLEFQPQSRPQGGTYRLDVNDAAPHGSAGSVTLIAQTLLWPLLFATGPARLVLAGGTHVPFSPSFHYLGKVAQPVFTRLGARFTTSLHAWGWNPAGGGELQATIQPVSHLTALTLDPVATRDIRGVAAVTNLPAHIPQRMTQRAHNLLQEAGFKPRIEPVREKGVAAGAGIFLWLPQAGFAALGRRGLPAEKVAETAVADLLEFMDNPDAAVDHHLADQLLLPMALANGRSSFTTDRLTQHTRTNADLLQNWLDVEITLNGNLNEPATITVTGIDFRFSSSG
jgi:RNA 3'-terminal phosphate cyclase (ATP)